jgi:hypothetical protein
MIVLKDKLDGPKIAISGELWGISIINLKSLWGRKLGAGTWKLEASLVLGFRIWTLRLTWF